MSVIICPGKRKYKGREKVTRAPENSKEFTRVKKTPGMKSWARFYHLFGSCKSNVLLEIEAHYAHRMAQTLSDDLAAARYQIPHAVRMA